jgi:hypothetical protein
MTQQIVIAAVAPGSSSSPAEQAGARPASASPQAMQRFEQLMFSPAQGFAPGSLQFGASARTQGHGMQMYLQHLSQRWESGQTAIKNILDNDKFTSRDLVTTQMQMINCAIDIEVSSKCAGIFESGVQTLVQRGGA